MKEILSLLKKYIFGICCVVVLIILQANCDLALPEYTSNIINVGIQQQGVENAVPKVIRKNSLESISVIAKDKTIIDNYELIEKGKLVLSNFIDAIAILIITTCVIPIAVLFVIVWIIKIIFDITIPVKKVKVNIPKFKEKAGEE